MKTKLIALFFILSFAASAQMAPLTLKKSMTAKGVTLNHWLAAEINENLFTAKTTLIMVPFANKAARLDNIENCFREFARIVTIDGTGWTRAQLKTKLQAPQWQKNEAGTDSTNVNFFSTATDE